MAGRLSVPMRALGLRALLLLALLPATTAAQGPALSVTSGRDAVARTAPGQIITRTFQLANPSPDSLRLLPDITVPPGWKVMAGLRLISLSPHGTGLWLVSLSIPNGARAGAQPVPLRLRGGPAGAVLFMDTLRLEVVERPRVQLRILDAPGYAIAGDTVSVRLLIQNEGNAPAEFRVELRAHGGLAADQRDVSFRLAPGASATHSAVFKAADVPQSQAAGVHVHATGAVNSGVRDSASVEIVVVPTSRRTEGLYHNLPGRLRVRAGEHGAASMLGELTGGGQLFDGHGPQVSFQLRSVSGSPLGRERAHYALGVRGEAYAVHLGDQVFETGALSGGGQAGFGVGGTFVKGAVTAGGFVSRERESTGEQAAQSAFASYRPGRRHEISSRLTRTAADGAVRGGTLATIAYAASPLAGTEVGAEYARGRSEKGSGAGYSLGLQGSHPWLSYNVAHRAGDESLPGPLRGSRSSSASVDVSAIDGVSFGAAAASYRQSAAMPFSNLSGGKTLSLHADLFGFAGAEYRRNESHVVMGGEDLRLGEEALRFRANARHGPLTVMATAESGKRSDPVTRTRAAYRDYTAVPTLSHGGTVVSAFARLVRGHGGRPVAEEGWSMGGSLSAQVAGRLRVMLTGSDNAPRTEGHKREQRLEARVDQDLPGQHLLSLRARRVVNGLEPGQSNSLSLEYSIPLGIPTSKTNTPGRVVGRVTDGESGPGLGGVLVRLDNQLVVSDRQGYVVFSKVKGGVHPLAVAGSRERGRVAIGDSLVAVGSDGSPRPFHLRMVHGAHVRGSVRMVISANGVISTDPIASSGLENLVLLLESGADTMFLVTDPHGNFDAGRVRPGRWTVSHVGGALPPLYAFEQNRIEFMVAAGEDREIRLVVRPRRRDVQMVASGEIIVEVRPAPDPGKGSATGAGEGAYTEVAISELAGERGTRTRREVVEPASRTSYQETPRPIASSRASRTTLLVSQSPLRDRITEWTRAGSTDPLFSPARAGNRAALAPARRTTPRGPPFDRSALAASSRNEDEDPPERPPRRDRPVPWDRPEHERVPWDPLFRPGRAPPA